MRNYKMLIISLLLLIFMVGAVSAADENVTDNNLEISDEINVDEEITSSEVDEVEEDDILEVSDNAEILTFDSFDLDPFDPGFDPGLDFGTVIATDMTMVYGDGSKFIVTYYDNDGNPYHSSQWGPTQLWVMEEGITEYGSEGWIADYEGETDEFGIALYDLNLPVGRYSIGTMDMDGNEFYFTLTVLEAYVLANNMTMVYGDGSKFIVTYYDRQGNLLNCELFMQLVVTKFGTDEYVSNFEANTDENGVAEFDLNLPVGKYTLLTMDPQGEFFYYFTLTVLEPKPTVNAENASFNSGSGSKYYPMSFTYINGTPLANENVYVSIDGVYNYTLTTDENGTVDFILPSLASGDHIMTITNPVTGEKTNITITYIKEETSISTAAVTTVYKGGKYVVFTLKDSNGAALSGKNVSVVLNGKTIKGVTDANGQFKVSTDGLAPKAYTATMTFAGDDYLVKSTATAKITVKKATPKMTAKKATFKAKKKTKKYSIVLKDNKNKAMKKVKITLKVGKKTYKATTNSKGKATFKITKLTKKGKYAAKVKFAGNKNYNAVTKKVKITVK